MLILPFRDFAFWFCLFVFDLLILESEQALVCKHGEEWGERGRASPLRDFSLGVEPDVELHPKSQPLNWLSHQAPLPFIF